MPRWNRQLALLCLFLAVVAVFHNTSLAQTPVGAGTQPSQPENPSPQPAAQAATGTVKLGAGDLIEISVYGVPDLATKARISNSGDVYLPLVDYVHIAELTVDEAQGLIEKRLEDGGFVRGPHVTIFVDESASQSITVIGEVNHPGPYPAIGDRRLFDLISAAGGLTDRAGRVITIVHRGDLEQKTELHLPSNLAEDTQDNVEIRPGDTIIVSRAGIVYVVGDVARPSGFMIEDNTLTVLKALALAGGGTRTSSLNSTKILRQTPTGLQQIPVPLKKIMHAKAPDTPLQKGDVLLVPGSSAKAVAYKSAEAAMAITTSVAVYSVHP
jgi:polysaccharide export outer membrane protein